MKFLELKSSTGEICFRGFCCFALCLFFLTTHCSLDGAMTHLKSGLSPELKIKSHQLNYKIIHKHPHNTNAFTQGLVFNGGYLYEGTGQHGSSSIRQLEIKTGRILLIRSLSPQFFGEGITIFKDNILQLTWEAGLAFVYEKGDFNLLKLIRYTKPQEGWGLTHNGTYLIASDGSSKLYFLEPGSFSVKRILAVSDQNGPIDQLNELEYIKGKIFANIWQQSKIVVINPETGYVTAWLDFSPLVPKYLKDHTDFVLNGIAYDPLTDHLYITGKMWPVMYEIKIFKK